MSELEERINSVLSDPEQMQRITNLAQSLMGGGDPQTLPEAGGGPDLNQLAALMGAANGGSDKRRLLEAMGPWLSPKRREKLERALRLTKLAGVVRLTLEERGDV